MSIKPFRADDPVSAPQLNDLRDGVLGLQITGSDGLQVSQGRTGQYVAPIAPEPILARVTGSSSPYSWQEVYFTGSGYVPGPASGSSAYERNNKTGLNGNVVRLFPEGGDWRFDWDTDCCKGSSCTTTIALAFFNFDGSQNFCTGPGTINWTVSGTTTSGSSVNITGSSTVSSPNYTLALQFSGSQLPEGNYTFSFVEMAAICGQTIPQDNKRFSPTSYSFTTHCPKTSVNVTTQASFDLNRHAISYGVTGCSLTLSDVSWDMSLDASVSGGVSECGRSTSNSTSSTNANGNAPVLLLYVKITSYPYTIKSTASGTNLLGADQTIVYKGCNQVQSDDWSGTPNAPYVYYTGYPVQALGCSTCCTNCGDQYGSVVDAQFALSGGLTGNGTSDPSKSPSRITLTSWVQPKNGVSSDSLTVTATVSRDRFATQTTTVKGLGCLGAVQLTPDSDHACGGCTLPLPKNGLHGTALGQSVSLTFANGQWSGPFNYTMTSWSCADKQGNLHIVTAPVAMELIFLGFSCNQGVRSNGVVVFFSSVYQDQEPSSCAATYNAGMSLGGYGPPSTTMQCSPFMATTDGEWTYPFNGGTGAVAVKITVSE